MLVGEVPSSRAANAAVGDNNELSTAYSNESNGIDNGRPATTVVKRPGANVEKSSQDPANHPREVKGQDVHLDHVERATMSEEGSEACSDHDSDPPEATAAVPVPLPHPTPATKTTTAASSGVGVVTSHRLVFDGSGWESLLASARDTVERTVRNETSQAVGIPHTSISFVLVEMEAGRLVADITLEHDVTLSEAVVQATLDTYPFEGMKMLLEMNEERLQQSEARHAVGADGEVGKGVGGNKNTHNEDGSVVNPDGTVAREGKGRDGSPEEAAAATPPALTKGKTNVVSVPRESEHTTKSVTRRSAASVPRIKTSVLQKGTETTKPRTTARSSALHSHRATGTPRVTTNTTAASNAPRTLRQVGRREKSSSYTPSLLRTPRTPRATHPSVSASPESIGACTPRRRTPIRYFAIPQGTRTSGAVAPPRRRPSQSVEGRAASNEHTGPKTPRGGSRKSLKQVSGQGNVQQATLRGWQKSRVRRSSDCPIPPQRVVRVGVSPWRRIPCVPRPLSDCDFNSPPVGDSTPPAFDEAAGRDGFAADYHQDTVQDSDTSSMKLEDLPVPHVGAPDSVDAEGSSHLSQHYNQSQWHQQQQRRISPLKDTPGISHGLRSPARPDILQSPDKDVKQSPVSGGSSPIL